VVVELYAKSPAQAISAWQAIEPVAQGLGSAGGELLGGLWVLLVSVAALRCGGLPKALNWLGILIGIAGIVSAVPVLREGAVVFGLLQIVWFIWLGIVMLRTRPSEESQWQSVSLRQQTRPVGPTIELAGEGPCSEESGAASRSFCGRM
jgi:hypothetical protein